MMKLPKYLTTSNQQYQYFPLYMFLFHIPQSSKSNQKEWTKILFLLDNVRTIPLTWANSSGYPYQNWPIELAYGKNWRTISALLFFYHFFIYSGGNSESVRFCCSEMGLFTLSGELFFCLFGVVLLLISLTCF